MLDGGCHVDAKSVTTIPRAQKTGRFTVVTRAHVTTLDVDANGRVSAVRYVTDGEVWGRRNRPDARAGSPLLRMINAW